MVASGRRLVAPFAVACALLAAACYGTSEEGEPNAGAGSGGTAEAGAGGADTGADGGMGATSGVPAAAGAGGGSDWPDPPTEAPEAVDLLFVIDNSISMADKQELLVQAIPQLVRRLITPNCVDADGAVVGVSDATGACVSGDLEFGAVTNLHLGIITSSIGGHGGDVCSDATTNPMVNDHARMLGSVRAGLTSWDDSGFLAWDPTGAGNSPPGESVPDVLVADFQDHVVAVGEEGCGYEAPLEAFYRFLIDPEPPEDVVQLNGVSQPQGTDQAILAQRAAFLRPNSLVGVIVLTDENDCSIVDEGQGWLVGLMTNGSQPFQMPRATSVCASDPNSECCRSCAANEVGGPPDGCAPIADDPACALGSLSAMEDNLNLRCYDQKRRFGFDLLYPVQRYIQGLSELEVPNRAGQLVQNPLFVRQGIVRHPSRVFLAGAVGVPWQDLTDGPSLSGAGLRYLTAGELQAQGRWQMILGNPAAGVLPTDPLMIESVVPRGGTHPLLEVPLGAPESTNPQENPINGHEQVATRGDDLQYACIFPLITPRDCATTFSNACDCNAEDLDRNRPLCQPPEGGPAGTMQYYAKAYPSVRHLQVLKGLGARSIVTSVCAKLVEGDVTAPAFGYNPLTFSVVEHAAPILRGEPLGG